MAARIPAAPEPVSRGSPIAPGSWDALHARLEKDREDHKATGDASREISKMTKLATLRLQLGEAQAAREECAAARAALDAVPAAAGVDAATKRRAWGLTHAAEGLAALEATLAFLETGAFPAPPANPLGLDLDAEYVAGLLGAAEALARYAVGRATRGDAASIGICRDGVKGLHGALLEFDFRNGPLRRKFDGLKYSLRRLEDLLYEQSLVGKTVADAPDDAGADAITSALAEIKARFDAADLARESVIKKSRDVQKGAKQAIFACHRGDAAKATKLIAQAAAAATAILDDPELIGRWPALRHGSLACALEEYAEAALFSTWLAEGGRVAGPADLGLPLSDEEYLGGVCDLTGEVGRVAVAAATKRDAAAVDRVYATDLAVLEQLARLPLPPKLGKKLDPLQTAVRKVEHVRYELALAAANPLSLKRTMAAPEEPEAKRGKNGDEDE